MTAPEDHRDRGRDRDRLITPAYLRLMTRYNSGMNTRLFDAAARLSDADRRRDRGAFWGSIHGTLNHLLWADRQWMSRFDGWDAPGVGQRDSAALIDDFTVLADARRDADRRIERWAEGIDTAWLDGELVWFSGSTGREMRGPRGPLIVHLFNHQTHHRGQVHAMLTAAGERTGDTDLFLVVPAG